MPADPLDSFVNSLLRHPSMQGPRFADRFFTMLDKRDLKLLDLQDRLSGTTWDRLTERLSLAA